MSLIKWLKKAFTLVHKLDNNLKMKKKKNIYIDISIRMKEGWKKAFT